MIIAHIFYDTRSLLACCLTCYSWYIAAVPHLHQTLITPYYSEPRDSKCWWDDSFQRMCTLGLFPLVKKFHFRGTQYPTLVKPVPFSPKLFDRRILRQFSALTNVQELGIDYLDIPSFMSKIRRYFGHFLPTVRSLSLKNPKGSRRQVIFFIGCFQHLEDLKLLYDRDQSQEEPVDDLTPVPPYTPPLRGRLTMTCITRVGILEDMIGSFGGIRFRHMDLFDVDRMRLLLDACGNTLESLRLYPSDPRAVSSPNDFDLSRNRSLRAIETTMLSLKASLNLKLPSVRASNLRHALSTITSPVFAEVIVLFRDNDFCTMGYHCGPPDHCLSLAPSCREVFEVLRRMRGIRDLELVLCADVWGYLVEPAVWQLKRAVANHWVKRGPDRLSRRPLVTSCPRGFLPAPGEPGNKNVEIASWIHAWAPQNRRRSPKKIR